MVPGEFAMRGGVVDIFPVTYRMPVRLEFRGDTLSKIRDFSLSDGQSQTSFEEVFLIPLSGYLLKRTRRLEERFEAFEPVVGDRDLESFAHPLIGS